MFFLAKLAAHLSSVVRLPLNVEFICHGCRQFYNSSVEQNNVVKGLTTVVINPLI